MGRASIFRGKVDGVRVQGVITAKGHEFFETARVELGDLFVEVMSHEPTTVSDADVIEYLARGHKGTRRYLKEQLRAEGRAARTA